MGMYNEVWCECPCCGKSAYTQIAQIGPGFGGYNLNNPDSMLELDEDQLIALKECVEEAWFECEHCGNHFQYDQKRKFEKRRQLIKDLFGV